MHDLADDTAEVLILNQVPSSSVRITYVTILKTERYAHTRRKSIHALYIVPICFN